MQKEDDLNRELDSVEKDARDKLRGIFSSLQSELGSAQKARKEAEDAAKEAEKKYGAALELEKEQYSRVIQEIFEEPKRDLIKKISIYSFGGIVATLAAAILSFVLTPVLLRDSVNSLADAVDQNLHKFRSIEGYIGELHGKVDDLDFQAAISDGSTLEIIRHLDNSKKDFNEYQTKMDLERMYKIRPIISEKFPSGFYYHNYRIAFRLFGIVDVPTAKKLQEWDVEAYRLYDNWYNFVRGRGPYQVPASDKARKWDSFKSNGDSTRYNWQYAGSDITFFAISQDAIRKRDVFLEQWRRNKKLMP